MGSSGGGGSGAVSHSAYLERAHNDWLDDTGVDIIGTSITEVMAAALGSSPWAAETPYNPDTSIAAFIDDLAAFKAILAAITDVTSWAALHTQAATSVGTPTAIVVADATLADTTLADATPPGDIVATDAVVADAVEPSDVAVTDASVVDGAFGAGMTVADMAAVADVAVADGVVADVVVPADLSVTDIVAPADLVIADKVVADMLDAVDVGYITDAEIIADVAAFADQLDDEITAKVLPRFRCGMRDIDAVVSSAFPIGEALIEAYRDRDVAKYNTGLRVAAVMKNKDVDISNQRIHFDVRNANLGKEVQLANMNLGKDMRVGEINIDKILKVLIADQSKDVQVGGLNMDKDVKVLLGNQSKSLQLVAANLDKSVKIGIANATKNTDIGKANLSKAINVGENNLVESVKVVLGNLSKSTQVAIYNKTKDAQIGIANLEKALKIVLANLDKSLKVELANQDIEFKVDATNLNKEVDFGKANLSKSLDIVKVNLMKALDIIKINLEKNVDIGKATSTLGAEYDRMYLEGAGQILKLMLSRISLEGEAVKYSVEANRIKIVAKKEETDRGSFINASDAKWDLEVFQYGANLLAAIGGGTVIPNMPGSDRAASVIGGGMALIGAAAALNN